MKRHIQKTGVRKFFGQDFIDLQTEPLAVLDGFFAEYGACVIEGCAITEADGGTFDVASGLVAIEATDPESGAVSIRTMPFEGVEGVALPLYLSAEWVVVERAYGDGKVKPIAYNLRAVASGIKPSKAYLMLTAAGGDRFVDVVQDGTHRFVSDSERAKWNDILRQAKEYAALQTEAAKRSAIEHTDAVAVAVRDELVVGDAATLVGAKQYADRIVAALVDSSPEALNTLQELAAALGGDPNFATTVMNEIGKRVTTEAMTTALAQKADRNIVYDSGQLGLNVDFNTILTPGTYQIETNNYPYTSSNAPVINDYGTLTVVKGLSFTTQIYYSRFLNRPYFRCGYNNASWDNWSTYTNTLATTAENGLMSKEDKAIVDTMVNKANASETLRYLGTNVDGGIDSIRETGYGFDTRATMTGAILNIVGYQNKFHCSQLLMGHANSRLMYRSFSHDTNHWSPWAEFLSTENFKIIRGSADENGFLTGIGCGNYVGSKDKAIITIYHDFGTRYSAVANIVSTNGGLKDNFVTIAGHTSNYTTFCVTNGGDTPEYAPFDFIIIPY